MFLDANCVGPGAWITQCGVCIPAEVASLTSLIYNAIKVIVPLVLIIIGMFDMAKAITSKSEDEIKKAQQLLVKKAIAGALVFVLFSLITWMLSMLSSTSGNSQDEQSVIACMDVLFNYDKTKSSNGGDNRNGYGSIDGVCISNNFEGAIRMHSSGSTYYSCFKKSDTKQCGNSESGYVLSDGNAYCLGSWGNGTGINATYQIIHPSVDTYFDSCMSSASSQGECDTCCERNHKGKGYYITTTTEKTCLCAKKQ